jgi:hypothetical protein
MMKFLQRIGENLPAPPGGGPGKLRPLLTLAAMAWASSSATQMVSDAMETLTAIQTETEKATAYLADLRFECELQANRLKTLQAATTRAAAGGDVGKAHLVDADALANDLADRTPQSPSVPAGPDSE